jgi:hypothetical protein
VAVGAGHGDGHDRRRVPVGLRGRGAIMFVAFRVALAFMQPGRETAT